MWRATTARSRLGIVGSFYYRANPGVRRMAEALAAHGYAVEVVSQTEPDAPAHETVAGVQVHRVGPPRYRGASLGRYVTTYARFFVQAAATLTRLHARAPFAAVQVFSMPEALTLAALWPRLQGTPIIYYAGDLTLDVYTSKFGARGGRAVAALLRLQERVGLGLADRVIGVHEEYRRRLLARGVPAERIWVLVNLPDDTRFAPAVREAARAGARPDEFVLVYHGSLVRRYGVDLLVRAVARLRERIPALRLRIYGDGDLRPHLVDLVAELALADRVTLSDGYVALEAIPTLVAAADVGVAPMRRDEFTDTVLPTKLMEYLALGMPAIVSRTRTVAEYFTEREVEYCVPDSVESLANAIERLWANPARRAALEAGARA
ncbi:MAG TPA: glycosyltransferase family 4 protein [Chloroflexota bacterium]|nr:glycosyltransferase family 4 protein [Chloroflexota bacterium]